MSTVATPLKLAVGQSINLEAHFAPVTAGAATGSIAITSNASDPSLVIGLSGTGVQGRLSATPASASFGDVALGVNDAKAVRLSNTGTSSLTVSHLSFTGKGFSMSTVATPLKLAVGQSINLEAHFTPVTAGAATGSIAITSNASDPSLVIALSGTGAQSGAQGRLSATPASASLGKVVVGENNSQTIRLNNTGDGSVIISRVNVVGSGFKLAGLTRAHRACFRQERHIQRSVYADLLRKRNRHGFTYQRCPEFSAHNFPERHRSRCDPPPGSELVRVELRDSDCRHH